MSANYTKNLGNLSSLMLPAVRAEITLGKDVLPYFDSLKIKQYHDKFHEFTLVIDHDVLEQPHALFYNYRHYYPNGKLHYEGKAFIKGDYNAGIWRTYDEQGVLVEETDYEKPFKFTIEQVLAFMKAHNIPLNEERTEVWRGITTFGPEWNIRYDDKENVRIGYYRLHGETGKLLSTDHTNYPE